MEIKLEGGKYTLRFDPSEIRISIDGEKIDIGARINKLPQHDDLVQLALDEGILTLEQVQELMDLRRNSNTK